MIKPPRPGIAWRGSRRLFRATVLTVVLAMVPAGCDRSKGATIDTASLTRAAASLALTVGEAVELYAAELPKGEWTEDLERMRSILKDESGALDFDTVGRTFSVAASASRKGGNSKVQAARQLLSAAKLASDAFMPPEPDYRPGDQDMLAAVASRLEPKLNAALASTYDFETGGLDFPEDLEGLLVNAVRFVLLIAGHNYVGLGGSHPVRDRMQALRMEPPPADFVDPAGNLRLPDGSETGEEISRFEQWRTSSVDGTQNRLWNVADGAPTFRALQQLFEPAADTALK